MTTGHAERLARFQSAGLYLVTSRSMSRGRSTTDVVGQSLEAGVRLVQLREKDLPARELLALAMELRAMTAEAGALLIINDRLDVALAADADGVHLGQDDLPIEDARRLAPDLILGASSHNVGEARAAQAAGASYVNIGPLFPTQTKSWQGDYLGLDGLREISRVLTVPFTVMGGIKRGHIPELLAEGAHTIALVTAITAADDPGAATRALLSLMATDRTD